jgi:hypothetical protein
MSRAEELIALAERVEALDGPDREVDRLICPLQGIRSKDEGHSLGRCYYDANGHGVPLPAYTASLDAAMTLVPEGWEWTISAYADGAIATCAPAAKAHPTILVGDGENALLPALALTAAALRARAAQDLNDA